MPDTRKYELELSTADAITLSAIFKERIKEKTDFLGRAKKNHSYLKRYPKTVESAEYQLDLYSRAYNALRGQNNV